MDVLTTMKQAGQALYRMFVPITCPVCGKRMGTAEQACCTECLLTLPYTHLKGAKGNAVERLFWGQFPIERASAWLYYHRGSASRQLIFDLKYHNRPNLGRQLGRLVGTDLAGTDFFRTIDLLVPVPLSKRRQRQRGYNVCDGLVQGVADLCNLPVCKEAVRRVVDNPTQTKLLPYLRKENVKGIFTVPQPERIKGRHILLIDDIITTGATVTSCAQALSDAGAERISILALAVSAHLRRTPPSIQE